ncbi:MAG: hypothetical protein Q9191_007412 [Dirinaria sp. TL-2023a]
MPKAARNTSGPKASTKRTKPYPTSSLTDKENVDPKRTLNEDSDTDHDDYRDIALDEIKGEVPCYDDAATVRRKLKKLLTEKSNIPGTSGKKWTQASMAVEMLELESRGHPVEYNRNASGPTTNSLASFLKKSGKLGGGDSPCYYWGYVMLEKLRIHHNEKKSKPRMKAEEEYVVALIPCITLLCIMPPLLESHC